MTTSASPAANRAGSQAHLKAAYPTALQLPDTAELTDGRPAEPAPDPATRADRTRLAVCIPLSTATIVLAMVPPAQFPGWQWVSLLLAAPVATWGAWPLHRAAWQGLGHGAATMDTLVSLGVTASFAWSVYALLFGGAGAIGMRMPFALTFGLASGQMIYFEAAAGVTTAVLAGRYLEARAGVRSAGGDGLAGGTMNLTGRRIVDSVAAMFVPCVIALSVVTLGFWLGTGLPAAGAWSASAAVLVVACPCALGLAVPGALHAAVGRGAELGVLVRTAQSLETVGHVNALVLDLTGTVGTFMAGDLRRPGAAAAMSRFGQLGLRLFVLTGDSNDAAALAAQLGIPHKHVLGGIQPAGKAGVVRELQASGYTVAMVGDGVNDAAALEAADLGLAMAAGSDAAIGASHLTLTSTNPGVIADAIELARATRAIVRTNLAWAVGYNVIAIPLAALGYLNPLLAGIAMSASSLVVVGNSLLLRRFRPGRARR